MRTPERTDGSAKSASSESQPARGRAWGRRHRRAALLFAVAAVLVSVTVPAVATSAGPLPPAIVVNPSTMLVDGESVEVTGSGFPAGVVVFMVQCLSGAGQAGCALGYQVAATTDAGGEFATTFIVSRLLRIDGAGTDCATPGACIIGAGVPPDGSAGSADAEIQFDPSIPLPPPPKLQVTPDRGLVEGQAVTASGTGFPDALQVGVVQCAAPALGAEDCLVDEVVYATVTGGGTFSTPIVVHRRLATPNGTVDCANPGACVLGAAPLSDQSRGATAPITFAGDASPSAPHAATPTATSPRFTG